MNCGHETAEEANSAAGDAVYGAVIRAVDDAIYGAVVRAADREVRDALNGATNSAVCGGVYWAMHGTTNVRLRTCVYYIQEETPSPTTEPFNFLQALAGWVTRQSTEGN